MNKSLPAEFLKTLHTGASCTVDGLTIVPLLSLLGCELQYHLYSDADAHAVRLFELNGCGPSLKLEVMNLYDVPLLMLTGQSCIGIVISPVLANDLLIPARCIAEVNSDCIDEDSWRYGEPKLEYRKRRFGVMAESGQKCMHDLNRFAIKCTGSMSLRDVPHSQSGATVPSRSIQTNASVPGDLERIFQTCSDAIGMAVFAEGRLLGIEIFNRRSEFAQERHRVLEAYLDEWLEILRGRGRPCAASPDLASIFNALEQSSWKELDSPGLGQGYECETESWAASALCYQGAVLHLRAFSRTQYSSKDV